MPWGLKRFQECRQVHFLTFSCYHRRPNFVTDSARSVFVSALERVRLQHELRVYGYVIMPEHIHLLVNEPERGTLAQAMQSLKQGVARRLALRAQDSFWQARYYDFNVWSEMKFVQKLRYTHRNPVKRGLVARPEDWPWSSFRHYATGEIGVVEIESQWTARLRERAGIFLRVNVRPRLNPPAQAELERCPSLRFLQGWVAKLSVHRCHQKPKGVAKVAAARKLAVRLYWMLRTNVAYPEIVRIENSPRVPLVGAR